MDSYNGDDLLDLFEKLNINLGHVHPSVVKGWFDTDNEDVKKVLNFICSSISEENYVSPRHQKEFDSLDKVLSGKELEEAVERLECQHPGILDHSSNSLAIEILEDQLELLKEQRNDYENQLMFNEKLSHTFSMEHSKILSEESLAKENFMNSQRKCAELSFQLEQANATLYKQLSNISTHAEFVNNVFCDATEEQFKDVALKIRPILKLKNSLEISCNIKENILQDLQNRLLHSKMKSIVYELECEQLRAEKKFLENIDTYPISPTIDISILENNIVTKNKQLDSLMDVLENCIKNSVEDLAGKCQIEYAQKELNLSKRKLESLCKIEEELRHLFCYFSIILLLYSEENINLKDFLQNMHSYTVNIRSCQLRNDSMLKIIKEYESFKELPIEKQCKLISSIMKQFNPNCNSINEILSYIHLRQEEVKSLEYKNFLNMDYKFQQYQQCYSKVKTMRRLLQSGPTCRLIPIPLALKEILLKANLNMKNQDMSVKSAMQLSFKAKDKRRENKWQRYRSLLWTFFLMDVPQLSSVLQQLEQEGKSLNKNAEL